MSTNRFCIAGTDIIITGDESFIAPELLTFKIEIGSPASLEQLTIQIIEKQAPDFSCDRPFIYNSYLGLYKTERGYIMDYPGEYGIEYADYDAENLRATIYTTPGADSREAAHGAFMALRLILSHIWQRRGLFLMHAASFIYEKKVYLVSAKSGTGKSTHVDFWKEAFPDEVKDYNGDLALLSISADGTPTLHGIPWNGTSGIFTMEDAELGGIIILHRSGTETSEIKNLPDDEQALSVMQRIISPSWHRDEMLKNKCFAEDLITKVPVWQLYAAYDVSSARFMKETIDKS